MSTTDRHDDVHDSVSKAYARAVAAESENRCCSQPIQKGVAAKLARYSSAELEALPGDAVVNSFGCGNPLAFAEVRPGDVVLDLGSGAGIDILLAGKKVGPFGRAIGIDMTDEMIARARENVAEAGLSNVEVRKGLIENLPVETASVDWVISNCVINLSPDKARVFAEIHRVLKPGGRLRISDIVVEDLPDHLRHDEALYNTCIAGAISEGAYIDGLCAAGLQDVEVRERINYGPAQLKAFVESEVGGRDTAGGCCGVPLAADSPGNVAHALGNKVWSAIFVARKPAVG